MNKTFNNTIENGRWSNNILNQSYFNVDIINNKSDIFNDFNKSNKSRTKYESYSSDPGIKKNTFKCIMLNRSM